MSETIEEILSTQNEMELRVEVKERKATLHGDYWILERRYNIIIFDNFVIPVYETWSVSLGEVAEKDREFAFVESLNEDVRNLRRRGYDIFVEKNIELRRIYDC